jgi:predicted Zn-dependent peptidase
MEELAKVRADGLTDEELHKAKELSKGRLLLRMEDTRSVSGWLGGQEILSNQVKTPDEIVALIEAVTPDDIRRVARKVLEQDQLSLAIVGPFKSDKRFVPLLKL